MEIVIAISTICNIVLVVFICTAIIAARIIIRKQKCKIKRHKEVNTYQHKHIADLTRVIADQKSQIDSYKFVYQANEEIIDGLVAEIEEKEKVIKLLTPTEIDGN